MTAIPEGLIWKGSPNFGALNKIGEMTAGIEGRSGEKLSGIVLHIMAGTLIGTDEHFANPASQVSAHFGIGKQGQLHQYVSSRNTAWANGLIELPDLTIGWLADAVRRHINPNLRTASLEIEGQTGDHPTEAQYATIRRVIKYLCVVYGIAPSHQTIIGHYQITAISRHYCPGSGVDFARVIREAAN